ncbi:MAG TPA: hypothetical protein VGL81_27365 [Polyangiaceae bacterium]|jgi:hypothetical protein
MSKSNHADHQTQGDVILQRLAASAVPSALKGVVAAFKTAHAALTSAGAAAESARAARDVALASVGAADDALDAALEVLANTMVGAQMGSRKNPFAGFSKHAPSVLTNLAYATEVKEAQALTAKVKKAKPAADVAKAAGACDKLAAAVTSALSKLSKPQLAYSKSLAARDALLPGWTKALNQLKRNAAAVWFDDAATYKAVFAPPERVQAPVRERAKKKAAPPVLPAPAKPTGT